MPSTKNYCYHETTKKDKEKSTDALDAFIVKSGVLNKTVKSYIDRKVQHVNMYTCKRRGFVQEWHLCERHKISKEDDDVNAVDGVDDGVKLSFARPTL